MREFFKIIGVALLVLLVTCFICEWFNSSLPFGEYCAREASTISQLFS